MKKSKEYLWSAILLTATLILVTILPDYTGEKALTELILGIFALAAALGSFLHARKEAEAKKRTESNDRILRNHYKGENWLSNKK